MSTTTDNTTNIQENQQQQQGQGQGQGQQQGQQQQQQQNNTDNNTDKKITGNRQQTDSMFAATSMIPGMEDFNQEQKGPEEYMGGTSRLMASVTISDNASEVFCIRFSPDGRFLAAGCGDGAIRVFNVATGRLSYNLQTGSNVSLPTTAIRFRPITASTRTKNVLVAANAAGTVQHWHMTSGKRLHSMEDDENQVYALDYRKDGTMFATGGKDTSIRVYNEATRTEVCCMKGGTGYAPTTTPGHSNRIFSLKFHPTEPDIIVSGGWDNTVQIWDMRVEHAVRSIYGPHICGDSLDISRDEIITGSWRPENPLQLWDFGSGELIENIPWTKSAFNAQPCMLYAAQFSKGEEFPHFIAAGGSGSNEAKVFDHYRGNSLVGTITGLSRGVFTLDFSPNNGKIAVAGGDASIRIIDIIETRQDEDII